MQMRQLASRLSRQYQALRRPAVLLLSVLLCVGFLTLTSDATAQGQIRFFLFHDRDGDGMYSTDTDRIPQGAWSLGLSGPESKSFSSQHRQLADGTFENATVAESLAAGDYYFDSIGGGDPGYACKSRLYVVYEDGRSDLITDPDNRAIKILENATTKVYIPLYSTTPASVIGQVVFADNISVGVEGASVSLLNRDDTLVAGQTVTTGADGSYVFTGMLVGGWHRIQAAPPDSDLVDYTLDDSISPAFQVLDGEQLTGHRFSVTRRATVEFYMGSTPVASASVVPGSTVSRPSISSQHLNFGTYYRNITGWYTDAARTQAWNFRNPVTQHTKLYAAWSNVSNSSSNPSHSERRGTNIPDRGRSPEIESVRAVLNEDGTIYLTVTTAGIFGDFSFRWEMRNSAGGWDAVPGGDSQSFTYTGVRPGSSYSFRVRVTRNTDGGVADSDVVTVYVPSPEPVTVATPVPAPSGSVSTPVRTVTLTVDEDEIFEGGFFTVTSNIPGGQWQWDEAVLEGSFDTGVTFLARKFGETEIHYTVNGISASVSVFVLPSELPATGQNIMPAVFFALAGIILLFAAFILSITGRYNNVGGASWKQTGD